MTATVRKGATRVADVPPEVLKQLNRGELSTVNLVEWLALDQMALAKHVLKQSDRAELIKPINAAAKQIAKPTAVKISNAIAEVFAQHFAAREDASLRQHLENHPADSVRCWAAFTVGLDQSLTLSKKLTRIKPFAKDDHFGVREVAWLAVRDHITVELERAISILAKWSKEKNDNVRRFASEATRPRGVWTQHIQALKDEPARALPILDPLKSDPSKYVRDSVGNWLNDAAKSQPVWVKELCVSWQSQSPSDETAYIIKRALRSL